MSRFDIYQTQKALDELYRLAMDAHREAEYATMERLLEQTALLAQRLDDLPQLVKQSFWLATARRMQQKHAQAIPTFIWLIGMATDPSYSRQVSDQDSLYYLANAFMDFVESGRCLPELSTEQLLAVVADGMVWLEGVGHADWMAGMRFEKGNLLVKQGQLADARIEYETALALASRHPNAPGYTVASYQLELAALLRNPQIADYAQAVVLLNQMLEATNTTTYDRGRSYKALYYTYLAMNDRPTALKNAEENLSLAKSTHNPILLAGAYKLLTDWYLKEKDLVKLKPLVAQHWRWARRSQDNERLINALLDCVNTRCLQTEQAQTQADKIEVKAQRTTRRLLGWAQTQLTRFDQAIGRTGFQKQLSSLIPANNSLEMTQRYARSMRRFLDWSNPIALKADEFNSNKIYQDELKGLSQKLDKLDTRLKKPSWF